MYDARLRITVVPSHLSMVTVVTLLSTCAGVGIYKIFFRLFWDCALVTSIISPTRLVYFAPLYVAHKQYRAMYASPPDPPLVCQVPYNIGNGNIV